MMKHFFDAHAHLQMCQDLPKTMQEIVNAGVSEVICNSTKEEDWQKVMDISDQNQNIFVALGIHPWYLADLKTDWQNRLSFLLKADASRMVGEIGLDKNAPCLDLQEQVLADQLEIAYLYNRPVHIHCVRAWDKLLYVFKKQGKRMPPKVLMHSHHGDKDLIPDLIKKYNAYFSYSSIVVPENHPRVRACLKATPIDRLLVESDAPDLAVSPAEIPNLVHVMSQILECNEEMLIVRLYQNAKEFVRV